MGEAVPLPTTTLELVPAPAAPPPITLDQLALIKATIAKDASESELELYLFDCRRRGVHPLDKLLHFSKRAGRYTPIVSIDYMRQRAAATHECAGIDDAVFAGTSKCADFAASVTVWRFVQGQRCPFTATARWSEYKPDQDFMWQKMPHLMLGKVAEALALRRAFPAELSGLYESSELDQADRGDAPPRSEAAGPRATAARARDESRPINKAMQRKLFAVATEAGWATDVLRAMLQQTFAVRRTTELRVGDFDQVLKLVQAGPSPEKVEPPPVDAIPF